jgi:hypothetical protein
MFVLMALAALPMSWVAYSLSWIRARHAALVPATAERLGIVVSFPDGASDRVPGGLWLFGETSAHSIYFGLNPSDDDVATIQRLFPEATIGFGAGTGTLP